MSLTTVNPTCQGDNDGIYLILRSFNGTDPKFLILALWGWGILIHIYMHRNTNTNLYSCHFDYDCAVLLTAN